GKSHANCPFFLRRTIEECSGYKRKRPGARPGRFVWDPDDDLLSRGIPRTIIGATPFHGPVRDGKAWFQRAVLVRNSVASRVHSDNPSEARGPAFRKKRGS